MVRFANLAVYGENASVSPLLGAEQHGIIQNDNHITITDLAPDTMFIGRHCRMTQFDAIFVDNETSEQDVRAELGNQVQITYLKESEYSYDECIDEISQVLRERQD